MSAFVQVQKSKLVNIPVSTLQLKLWMCMSVWEGSWVEGAKAVLIEKSPIFCPSLPINLPQKKKKKKLKTALFKLRTADP